MSLKRVSQLALLQLDIGSVYTTIFSCTKIEGPDGEVMFEDVTDLSSTYVEDGEPTGLSSPGSIKTEGFFDPQAITHQTLLGFVKTPSVANTKKNWKIVVPIAAGGTAVTAFVGSVKNFPTTWEAGKHGKYSMEIKLSAPATLTPAT